MIKQNPRFFYIELSELWPRAMCQLTCERIVTFGSSDLKNAINLEIWILKASTGHHSLRMPVSYSNIPTERIKEHANFSLFLPRH